MKPFQFKRHQPDLPAAFEPNQEPIDSRNPSIIERELQGFKLEGAKAGNLLIDSCILDHVSFPGTTFSIIKLKDVKLLNCDLANLEAK